MGRLSGKPVPKLLELGVLVTKTSRRHRASDVGVCNRMTLFYEIGPTEYDRANRLHLRPRTAFQVAAIVVFALFVAALALSAHSAFTNGGHVREFVILILGLAFFICFFTYILPLYTRRSYKSQAVFRGPFRVEITEEGLHVDTVVGQRFLAWGSAAGWKRNRRVILIYLSPTRFYIFPVEAFGSDEDLRYFKSLLLKRAGRPIS